MPEVIQEVWTDADENAHRLTEQTVEALQRALGGRVEVAAGSGPIVARPGGDLGLGEVEVTCEDGSRTLVQGRLPRDFPLGYHRLRTGTGQTRRLIVSPGRCFLPEEQTWGWAVQLYATRSADSWGIGDLRDLRRLRTWAQREGAGFLLVNPLHATAPVVPQETSPYLPTTRRFLDPLYLCVPEVPGHEDSDVTSARLEDLRTTDLIDRDAVARVKLGALRAAHDRTADTADFRSWRDQQDDAVEQFALWCVLAQQLGADWHTWPAELHDPSGPAVRALSTERAADIGFHVWLQWQLQEQLTAAAGDLTLIQDLPIGVSGSGADAWAWQDLLAPDTTVGAPPDKLNSLGQDWGSPPWVPWRLQEADYEPFVQTVRRTIAGAGGLRIDHVMGLFRLWWIPGDAGSAQGGYVRYPSDDLLDIVALESHRARAVVVGEDLGTVEEGVSQALADRAILSYKVLWFEDDDPAQWPSGAMATVTTHDLPTVTGLWTGSDAQEQVELTDMSEEDIRNSREELLTRLRRGVMPSDAEPVDAVTAAYRQLFRAPSRLLCMTLEDAVCQERRPNVPGTNEPRNWSIPLPVLIDDLPDHPGVRRLLALCRESRASQ
ncbi:MAG: 4-alpha-glucanotransferase [Marmoricola sp.]